MKNNEQSFYKIEDYLSGKLLPEAAAAFEQEISADSELAEMVELQRLEREGLEFMMEEKLRSALESWKTMPPTLETESSTNSTSNSKKFWFGWKYIIFLLMLVIAGFFWFKSWETEDLDQKTNEKQQPSNHLDQNAPGQLPAQNQTPIANTEGKNAPKTIPVTPSTNNPYAVLAYATHKLPENITGGLRDVGSNPQKSVLDQAIKDFKHNPPDFKHAILELRKIKQAENPEVFGTAQEMLAHSYFETGQFDRAAVIFESMARQNLSPSAHDQAEWNLLLSLLPNYSNKKIRVDGLLDKMIDPKSYHDYEKQASALKMKLAQVTH